MKKALLITFLGLFCFLQAFPQDKKPFITLDNLQLNTRAERRIPHEVGLFGENSFDECPVRNGWPKADLSEIL
ncbi:MAG: hypothetical protein IKD78_14370, partial [Bacteroidales bacterium]|nr:hypothetical protein [Bacteroidales bacterium]